jgi:hypothetical protein
MNFMLTVLLSLLLLDPTAGGGKGKPKKASVTIEGEFRSVHAVMNPLSCYCNDGGYVTTASGDEIAVCFEKGQFQAGKGGGDKSECDRIQVTGTYKTEVRKSGENDPCPDGTMQYLSVTKFKCL